jgi:hypothetical protein
MHFIGSRFLPRISRGLLHAVNSLSDSCTGIGVVAGFAVAVLIRTRASCEAG